MTMNTHDRAKLANAAMTPEGRAAGGRARAARMHSPIGLAERLAAKWPEMDDDERREVRRELRKAGVIA